MNIAMTFFPGLRAPQGQRKDTTWPALCRWLSVPRIEPVKSDGAGFSVATYHGERRALANVDRVFAVGLDLDHLDALSTSLVREPGVTYHAPDLTALRARFSASSAFVHTTWSSTIDSPRLRVFLLLSRPVTGDEYRRVYQAVARNVEAGGLIVDRAASDPSRFWFCPAIPVVGRSFIWWTCTGAPVDVDAALAAVPPPPPPSVPSRPTGPVGDVEVRAERYLAQCEPAISGSGGSARTFMVAQRLVRGFSLDADTAYRLLAAWNQRCSPPWSERDLRRKLTQAATQGRMADGDLRDAERRR